MSTLERIEKFMLDQILVGFGKETLTPDEDLLDQGIIDSLGIMKLIVFIEDSFNLKIDDGEIVPENFQSLDSMVRFVQQKAAA
jgi:acyl carrier protein